MKSLPWLFLYFAVLFPVALLGALAAWTRLRKKSGPLAGDTSERPLATTSITRKAV